jgi:hypothetical protein
MTGLRMTGNCRENVVLASYASEGDLFQHSEFNRERQAAGKRAARTWGPGRDFSDVLRSEMDPRAYHPGVDFSGDYDIFHLEEG